MLHSAHIQHNIWYSGYAGNKNIKSALIEVTHVEKYTARCRVLQVKKIYPSLPSQNYYLVTLLNNYHICLWAQQLRVVMLYQTHYQCMFKY